MMRKIFRKEANKLFNVNENSRKVPEGVDVQKGDEDWGPTPSMKGLVRIQYTTSSRTKLCETIAVYLKGFCRITPRRLRTSIKC
jgi:hypothetical protein